MDALHEVQMGREVWFKFQTNKFLIEQNGFKILNCNNLILKNNKQIKQIMQVENLKL